jgi:hypothetical protein
MVQSLVAPYRRFIHFYFQIAPAYGVSADEDHTKRVSCLTQPTLLDPWIGVSEWADIGSRNCFYLNRCRRFAESGAAYP